MEIEPLTLMVIGMLTVFFVLILVVLSGNVLISLVNKFVPEEAPKVVTSRPAAGTFEKNKLTAVVAAVEWATKGKGRITKIEKN